MSVQRQLEATGTERGAQATVILFSFHAVLLIKIRQKLPTKLRFLPPSVHRSGTPEIRKGCARYRHRKWFRTKFVVNVTVLQRSNFSARGFLTLHCAFLKWLFVIKLLAMITSRCTRFRESEVVVVRCAVRYLGVDGTLAKAYQRVWSGGSEFGAVKSCTS